MDWAEPACGDKVLRAASELRHQVARLASELPALRQLAEERAEAGGRLKAAEAECSELKGRLAALQVRLWVDD